MAKTIDELVTLRNEAWDAAKKFLDKHTQDNGLLSEEDSKKYDDMVSDIDAYKAQIDRLTRQAAIDADLDKPVSKPLNGKPGAGADAHVDFRATDQYRRSALKAMRTKMAHIDNYLSEGVTTEGGYLVPEEWDNRLIEALEEENIMRGLATIITTEGLTRVPLVASAPAASWIEEGGAVQFGSATFDQVTIDAYKLHVAVQITEELLADEAYDLEGWIATQFGKALGNAEEDAFLNGDGSGKPTGLFASATQSVNGSLSESDSILDLVYALARPYRKNASFILNDANLATVRKVKDSNGQYIWQPSYQAGEPDRIAGYVVNTSAYAPTDMVAFGDYSYYNIADRGTRVFTVLNELFAANGLVGYIMKERVDGKLLLPEAVQVLTVSDAAEG